MPATLAIVSTPFVEGQPDPDAARRAQTRYYGAPLPDRALALHICDGAGGILLGRFDGHRRTDTDLYVRFLDGSMSLIDEAGVLHYYGPPQALDRRFRPI